MYLVPFRSTPTNDRLKQLDEWLICMERLCATHRVDFECIVAEHVVDGTKFNRGACLNVAAVRATSYLADWLVLHDCDLVPSARHFERAYVELYVRPLQTNQVVHMASSWTKYMYPTFLGGALAVPCRLFWSVGGMPNSFFGWGGEDDAFRDRLVRVGASIQTFPKNNVDWRDLERDPSMDGSYMEKKTLAPKEWQTDDKKELLRRDRA